MSGIALVRVKLHLNRSRGRWAGSGHRMAYGSKETGHPGIRAIASLVLLDGWG